MSLYNILSRYTYFLKTMLILHVQKKTEIVLKWLPGATCDLSTLLVGYLSKLASNKILSHSKNIKYALGNIVLFIYILVIILEYIKQVISHWNF